MYNLRASPGSWSGCRSVPTSRMVAGGPPFQMPYTLALPSTEANRWRVHRDTLDAAERLYGQLRGTFGRTATARTIWPPSLSSTRSSAAQVELLITAAPPVPVPVGGPVP